MKGEKKRVKKFGTRKIIILLAVVLLILISLNVFYYQNGSIKRSFSDSRVAPGESFEVSLNIKLDKDQGYYLLEETIPEGFVTTNENAKGNKIRLIEIQDAESNVFTYTVQAPTEAGTYVFYGEYGMELVNGTRDIGGDDTIIVE